MMTDGYQRTDTADFLFGLGTWAMTIVLGLIFDKIANGVVATWTVRGDDFWHASTMLSILLTMMVVMVSVLCSLAYVHSELRVPYLRLYLLWDLIGITMPIYIGIECAYCSAFGEQHAPIWPINLTLFRVAMGFLAFVFVSLFFRGRVVLPKIQDEEKRRDSKFFLPFHAMGFVMCFLGMAKVDDQMYRFGAAAALLMSSFYLVFLFLVWAGRLRLTWIPS